MDKINESQLNLHTNEVKRNREVLEKYRELTAKITAEISELRDDQNAMPYLKRLFALLPCVLILIGQISIK